jgi:hypothetical protein
MNGLSGTMTNRPDGGKRLAMGNLHVPPAPERDAAETREPIPGRQKLTIKAPIRLALRESSRPDSFGTKPIPVCSQINKYDKDQLWTSAALPVDGLHARLRGFRKSHQLIRATPRDDGDCSRQRHVSQRVSTCCVRTNHRI